jgi:hypothetical protein
MEVRRINGSVEDVLDYEQRKDGLTVIAIGGDKLARGLTLEGLSVSYFLRASKMYDTLMQMGRWFGYRPAYLDLCRLFLPAELQQWFAHIAVASEELRQEFDRMVDQRKTPREYGLRVRSHESLLVTSAVKMRSGTTLRISFGGGVSETISWQLRHLETNFGHLQGFIAALDRIAQSKENPQLVVSPEDKELNWKGTFLWRNVPALHLTDFLEKYQNDPAARRANTQLWAQYIRKQLPHGELVTWNVALLGKKGGPPQAVAGHQLGLINRDDIGDGNGRYLVRRLVNPRDECIDLSAEDYRAALLATQGGGDEPALPSGPHLRRRRSPQSGLCLIYPLDPAKVKGGAQLPPVGLALSFPYSDTAETVEYEVNNTYWTQEFGEAT